MDIQKQYATHQMKSFEQFVNLKKQYNSVENLLPSFHNTFVFKSKLKNGETYITRITSQGKQICNFKLKSQVSNLEMLNQQIVICYSKENKTFIRLDLSSKKQEQDKIEISYQKQQEASFIFFKYSRTICVILKDLNKMKIQCNYYSLTNEAINPAPFITFESSFYKDFYIRKIDQHSKLAWFSTSMKQLSFTTHEVKDHQSKCCSYKYTNQLPSSLTNINLKIMNLWYVGDTYYAVIQFNDRDPSEKDQSFSPIIKIQLDELGQQIINITYSQIKINPKYDYMLDDCDTLGDYVIVKTTLLNEKTPVYILSKSDCQIVCESTWTCRPNCYYTLTPNQRNQYSDVYFDGTKKSLSIQTNSILPRQSIYQNIIYCLGQIQSLSASTKNLLLILGAKQSGKSILRHLLIQTQIKSQLDEQRDVYYMSYESPQLNLYSESLKSKTVWMNSTEFNDDKIAIAQIPDYRELSQQEQSYVMLLMSRILQKFNTKLIVTIPLESISDPYEIINAFKIIDFYFKKIDLTLSTSIVLTKLQKKSDSQIFYQKVEEIEEENQKVFKMIKSIHEEQHISFFMNQQVYEGVRLEFLEKFIGVKQFGQNCKNCIKFNETSFKQCFSHQKSNYLLDSNETIKLVYKSLLNLPSTYHPQESLQIIDYHSKQLFKLLSSLEEPNQQVAYNLLQATVLMKIDITDNQGFSSEKWICLFEGIASEIAQIDPEFAQKIKNSIYRLAGMLVYFQLILAQFRVEQQHKNFINIFTDQQRGLFGTFFNEIRQFCQKNPKIKEIKQFDSMIKGEQSQQIRYKKVPYAYIQQKKLLSKQFQSDTSRLYCLPSNSLKLDLLLQHLQGIWLNNKSTYDYRKINFALREISKVLLYHDMYIEAITTLMVIPDFTRIGMALEEFMIFLRKSNYPYEKALLSDHVMEFLIDLKVFCDECLRTEISAKLIEIIMLNKQNKLKVKEYKDTRARNFESFYTTDEDLQNYKKKIQLGKDNEIKFYNKENQKFRIMISNKNSMIETCKSNQHESKRENIISKHETLAHLISNIPTDTEQ